MLIQPLEIYENTEQKYKTQHSNFHSHFWQIRMLIKRYD